MGLCPLPVIWPPPNYGGGDADNGDLLQKAPRTHCYTQGPHPSSRPPPTHASAETPGHSRASLGQALVGSLLLPLGPGAHEVLFVPSQSLFPRPVYVLEALWWVNGDLLQEGFCHAQVHCTQRPCPCRSPLPTRTSSGDTQTQFCLRFCRVSEPWCSQGMFEPSEHRWQAWGLILNVILPLLPSFWVFSVLGCGVSPHSHSSATQLPFQAC